MSEHSRKRLCVGCDEPVIRWTEWEIARKKRVQVLQHILNHPTHNDGHKLFMVEERMENFELEDESVRRLKELQAEPPPAPGSDEARVRRQNINEHVMKLFMMDHLVYVREQDASPSSSTAQSQQPGCRDREIRKFID